MSRSTGLDPSLPEGLRANRLASSNMISVFRFAPLVLSGSGLSRDCTDYRGGKHQRFRRLRLLLLALFAPVPFMMKGIPVGTRNFILIFVAQPDIISISRLSGTGHVELDVRRFSHNPINNKVTSPQLNSTFRKSRDWYSINTLCSPGPN